MLARDLHDLYCALTIGSEEGVRAGLPAHGTDKLTRVLARWRAANRVRCRC